MAQAAPVFSLPDKKKGPYMRYPDEHHDVTGVDKYAMERISLLRDAPDLTEYNQVQGLHFHDVTDAEPIPRNKVVGVEGEKLPSLKDAMRAHPLDFTGELLKELSPEDVNKFIERWYAAHNGTPPKVTVIQADMEEDEFENEPGWMLTIPKSQVPGEVTKYLQLIETGTTKEWCRCPWAVHPDHQHIPEDHCTACGGPADAPYHATSPIIPRQDSDAGMHHFKGRAVRRVDTDPMCPQHTREGLVLGFFEWLFRDQDDPNG